MDQVHAPAQPSVVIVPAKKDTVVAFLTVLCIALLAYVALHQSQPPTVAGADAPAADFSAARAMKHLVVIAQHPHPIGSSEHAKVRDYIMGELNALGLSPEIQKTSVVNTNFGAPFQAGHVENVVARLKGMESGKAIMMVSHYDSTATSFGASDNGTAVATLLETARALKSSTPLKHDLIFLFTDGEEAGLLGAKAFVDEHPWAKDVSLVLNFDARGNSGSAIMFETSNQDGALIRGFARSAPYPVTTSLSSEIYKRLPNDTDFTVFRRAGIAGLNFAYLNGLTHYHSRLDNLSNMDERSLQHQGSYALALAHQFGDGKEEIKKEGNAVYFNIFRTTFYYSQRWVLPLVILVTVLFIAVAVLGLKKKQLTLKGTLLGVLAFFAAVVAACLVTMLVWFALQLLPLGDTYHQYLYAGGFIALAVAVFSIVNLLFRGKTSAPNLWLGALVWWLLLTIATGVLLPGGSYLLAWPLLFSLIGLGVMFLTDASRTISTKSFIVLLFCTIAGFLLLVPIVYFVYLALGMSGLLALMLLVTLLLGLLLPLQSLVTKSSKWVVPAVAALVFLGCIVTGSAVSKFDEGHPRQNSIFYGENADTREAVWATLDSKPDAYTSQFFSSGARTGSINDYVPVRINLLYSPAPFAELPAPKVELLSDSKDNSDVRSLKLRVTSPRGAPSIRVYLDSGVEVLKAEVAGKLVDQGGAPQRRWGINYQALPPEGIELMLQVRSPEPVKIRVMDQSFELPQLSASQKPRPTDTMPASLLPYSDSTLISKIFTF
ncbi:MAG TPA: M20/M25/M40 family metallo-hydrolase [Pyrinomonadaceae bacterium]|nr:M20/M25/M40 family metallo-hydrolase [Pyrinomonadaceae bacterium]